ncbi:S8 family serine peptidase [Occultella gossypii]|uniref:S8 family serine peptidase n=1 Tax=Occultella gossypii TaxID=2800820 RepID=A0ABS7SHL0_9MICO|nr:S8 family serine peptidase [Occultella gossypii]MBZ2198776.1 S8 family serine peptidase [Occultella gossypii]
MLRKTLVLASAIALATPLAAVAAPPERAAPSEYAIVTLESAPLATYAGGEPGLPGTRPQRGRLDPTSPAYRAYERFLANEHANYRTFVAQRIPQAEVIAEYDTVLNGFAVRLNGASLQALANAPGVADVTSSWTYRPTMNASVDVINAVDVWQSTHGETDGAGIDVGIIDTGIREDHPFFACKDEISHKVYASGVAGTGEDIVFNHGTHVAGTVAGCVTDLSAVDPGGPVQGTISGVAPGANLFDYNVFPGYGGGFVGQDGSAFSHDIVRAVEDAVNDGMEVINLSLGGSIQGPHDSLAEAINAAAAAGVVAAVAAGNEGPGPSTVGSPGNALGALTAGATTNPHYVGVNVAVAGVGDVGAAVGDFDPFAASPVTDAPFAAWSAGTDTACPGSSPDGDVSGAVVLVQRGTCTFAEKVASAAAAGAIGVVVYNNVGGDPTAMGGEGEIPAVMVSLDDGLTVKAALPSTVTIDGSMPVEVLTENADILAGFSSRGPAPFTENIKPDVMAPGVNIFSSVFDEATGDLGWAMFQGTSMATPHVAGSAALLLAHDPGLSPTDVKSLLGNNAERQVWAAEVGGALATVMERGGGRIDLTRAFAATATFDPMSLSFGISNGNGPVVETITVSVRNLSSVARTFDITGGSPAMTFPASVDVPAGGTATFDVTLSTRGPAAAEGDLVLTGGDETFLLPFWYSNGNRGN